jgi:hypothetical protein
LYIHGHSAARAEAVVAAVYRRTAWTGGYSSLTQHRDAPLFLQGALQRPQLRVDVSECGELGDNQLVVALTEAMQIEDQATEVAVGQLACLAQEMQTPAHASTLPEPRCVLLRCLGPCCRLSGGDCVGAWRSGALGGRACWCGALTLLVWVFS